MPAFIAFGNGRSYSIVIRSPWMMSHTVGNKYYDVIAEREDLNEHDKRIISALMNFDLIYGNDIEEKMSEFRRLMRSVFDHEIKSPPTVELGVLAVASGYKWNKVTLESVAYAMLGIIVNTAPKDMDNRWGFPMSQIGAGAKQYVMNGLLVNQNLFATMFVSLFTETFPDPVHVLSALNTTEQTMRHIFVLILGKTLTGCNAKGADFPFIGKNRGTRLVDLACKDPDKEERCKLLWNMLPLVPHPTYGGARFVEPLRRHFIDSQLPAMQKIFGDKICSPGINVALLSENYRDGRCVAAAWEVDVAFGHQVLPEHSTIQPGTEAPGLTMHPKFANLVGSLEGVTNQYTGRRMHKRVGKNRQEAGIPTIHHNCIHSLLEGAFHAPDRVETLLKGMTQELYDDWEEVEKIKASNPNYKRSKRKPDTTTYNRLRKHHYLRTGKWLANSQWDELTDMKLQHAVADETRARRKDPNRQIRIAFMEGQRELQEPSGGKAIDLNKAARAIAPGTAESSWRTQQRSMRKRQRREEESYYDQRARDFAWGRTEESRSRIQQRSGDSYFDQERRRNRDEARRYQRSGDSYFDKHAQQPTDRYKDTSRDRYESRESDRNPDNHCSRGTHHAQYYQQPQSSHSARSRFGPQKLPLPDVNDRIVVKSQDYEDTRKLLTLLEDSTPVTDWSDSELYAVSELVNYDDTCKYLTKYCQLDPQLVEKLRMDVRWERQERRRSPARGLSASSDRSSGRRRDYAPSRMSKRHRSHDRTSSQASYASTNKNTPCQNERESTDNDGRSTGRRGRTLSPERQKNRTIYQPPTPQPSVLGIRQIQDTNQQVGNRSEYRHQNRRQRY